MSVTVKAIQYVYGKISLSPAQVRHWFRQFRSGRNRVVDLPRRSKEKTGCTPDNIKKIQDLLSADKRLSIAALSSSIGIPWSTCRKIVRWDLNLTEDSKVRASSVD